MAAAASHTHEWLSCRRRLPDEVRDRVYEFLSPLDVLVLSAASKKLRKQLTQHSLWAEMYFVRFGDKEYTENVYRIFLSCFHREKHARIGDAVQVAWSGAFNLVNDSTIHGYEGKAWWDAVVVGRSQDLSRYKVHYPNWDATVWDEWVDADRIRWCPTFARFTSRSTAFSLRAAPVTERDILPGDAVEVLCPSTLGVSPWLETVVCKVEYTSAEHSCWSDSEAKHVAQSSGSSQRSTPRIKGFVCKQGIIAAPQFMIPGNVRLKQKQPVQVQVEEACVSCSPKARARSWGAPPGSAVASLAQSAPQTPSPASRTSRWQRAKSSLRQVSFKRWRG